MSGVPSVAHVDPLEVEIENRHVPSVVRFLLIAHCDNIHPRVFESDMLSQQWINLDGCLIRVYEGLPIEGIEVEGSTLRYHAVGHELPLFGEVFLPAVIHDIRLPLIEVKVHEHVVMLIIRVVTDLDRCLQTFVEVEFEPALEPALADPAQVFRVKIYLP